MNSTEREALDRHITGNYGEDQFPTNEGCDYQSCERTAAFSAWWDGEGSMLLCPLHLADIIIENTWTGLERLSQ